MQRKRWILLFVCLLCLACILFLPNLISDYRAKRQLDAISDFLAKYEITGTVEDSTYRMDKYYGMLYDNLYSELEKIQLADQAMGLPGFQNHPLDKMRLYSAYPLSYQGDTLENRYETYIAYVFVDSDTNKILSAFVDNRSVPLRLFPLNDTEELQNSLTRNYVWKPKEVSSFS